MKTTKFKKNVLHLFRFKNKQSRHTNINKNYGTILNFYICAKSLMQKFTDFQTKSTKLL